MGSFLSGMNQARNKWKQEGHPSFSSAQLDRYSRRYDEIIAFGLEQEEKCIVRS